MILEILIYVVAGFASWEFAKRANQGAFYTAYLVSAIALYVILQPLFIQELILFIFAIDYLIRSQFLLKAASKNEEGSYAMIFIVPFLWIFYEIMGGRK